MRKKCILSLRVARHLLSRGFCIIDLERSRKVRGDVVFIFEDTPELNVELAKLSQTGR